MATVKMRTVHIDVNVTLEIPVASTSEEQARCKAIAKVDNAIDRMKYATEHRIRQNWVIHREESNDGLQ